MVKATIRILSALLVVSPAPEVCLGGAGDLDPTFGDGGKVTTDFIGPGNSRGEDAIAVQTDGKTVVVGRTSGASGSDFALARFNADGTLDMTFGSSGLVSTDFASGLDSANAVAIQADGRIVVAGVTASAGDRDFALARYNPDGTLDTTLGSGGLVTTDLGSPFDRAFDLGIQANGKIVIVGTTGSDVTDFALVRYNPDGTLDMTFGNGGLVITDLGSSRDGALALAIQTDGRIVVAGSTISSGPAGFDFAVARYNSDGTLDATFGTGGVVTTDFASIQDSAVALAIQADGKIVVGGSTGGDLALARYNPDGTLDATFGTSGLVSSNFAFFASAVDLAIQADGRIVVAGVTDFPTTRFDYLLARYDPDGILHAGFGTDGLVSTDFGSEDDFANALIVQADGKIVVVGTTGSDVDFALVRYHPDGMLDSTFGNGGLVITDLGSSQDSALAVAIQVDGKIVVAGSTFPNGPSGFDFALVRYNADGTLDSTFGSGGLVTTDLDFEDIATALAIQADGRIVVAGGAFGASFTSSNFALARYNADGSLDATFGTGGLVTTGFGSGVDFANDLVIQSDGRIVLAGFASSGSSTGTDFALSRHNADGTLDATFGTGGLITTDFASGDDFANALAIYTDGRIAVAGFVSSGSPTFQDFGLALYNTDGSLVTTFGDGGKVTTDFASSSDSANALAIQADGKIVVPGGAIGASGFGLDRDFALARYQGVARPQEFIESIVAGVQNLVGDPLSNGQGNSLLVKLQGAIQKLDHDQTRPAINLLEAFINEVEAMVSAGILSPEEGASLIVEAEIALLSLLD